MWREEKVEIDDKFEGKDCTVPLVQFLCNLKGKLEDMVDQLDRVKQDHEEIKRKHRFSKETVVYLTDFVNPSPAKFNAKKTLDRNVKIQSFWHWPLLK